MRHWLLPNTDLWISAIVMGTGSFTLAHEKDHHRQLEQYAELDGNLIDTASIYGQTRSGDTNHCEQLIGRWLKESSLASEVLISTKGGAPLIDDPRQSRLNQAEVEADLDASLQALGREAIDIYYLHRDDPQQPVSELLGLLQTLRRKGKIRYFGLSNWAPERVATAIATLKDSADPGLVAIQNRWSLVRFNDKAACDPALVSMNEASWNLHRRENLAIMPYSSMGKGYFSKYLQNTSDLTEKLQRAYQNALNHRRAEALRHLSAELKISISQLVLAWLLHQPMPVYPVVSFSRLDQLRDAVGAAGINLPFDVIERMNAGSNW